MTTSAVGASPEMPQEARAGHSLPQCPECAARFQPGHPRAIFCCDAHRKAWEVRNTTRARMLYPFAVASRVTRGGSRGDKATGRRALVDLDQLLQRWRDEDAAANDGRGRMDVTAYLARRYRLGYDRP